MKNIVVGGNRSENGRIPFKSLYAAIALEISENSTKEYDLFG